MNKIKVGDSVKVTAGKDKGREAQVEQVLDNGQKVLLPGVNIYKRHIKAAMAIDGKGGIYDIPRPLNVAKVALICPNCKKVTRVGIREEGGKKVRYCKKCDRVIGLKEKSKSKK